MINIDATTKIYGLIGQGISGSYSPFIHNTLNKYMGINSVYVCFETSNIEEAIKGGIALGISGFNITTPFKQKAIPFLKDINTQVKLLNSTNTLVYKKDGYKGYNTDYYGFLELLKRNNINVQNKKILVIGAGGTSSTICKVLDDLMITELHIANRTVKKADIIKENLNSIKKIYTMNLDEIDEEYDIIIQTTTVGFGNSKIPIDIEKIKKCTYAIDVIYGKEDTTFIKECKNKSIQTINGLDMLFYQGVKAYELFNDIKVSEKIINDCKNELYKKVYD